MKYFITLMVISFTPILIQCSKCITIRRKSYTKEVLTKNFKAPYQLTIDHVTKTLFFSYTKNGIDITFDLEVLPFKLGYFNLITKKYGDVDDVEGGFATAVDDNNQVLYAGGDDGIYTLNPFSLHAKNLKVTGASIWQMFYRNGLYFTTYPDHKAFLYKDKRVTEISNLGKVKMIAVTKFGSLVVHNSSGLFICNGNRGMAVKLGNFILTGFSSDDKNDLYFATTDRICRIRKKIYKGKNNIQELGRLGNVYGLTVESKGNFIYSTKSSIIRLKPSARMCDTVIKNNATIPKSTVADYLVHVW